LAPHDAHPPSEASASRRAAQLAGQPEDFRGPLKTDGFLSGRGGGAV